MKVSLNWVKQYLAFDLPPTAELVEKIGAQLGGVDEVIDLGKKYQGIIIAKVVSCEKHPDADKLSLCKIDDGGTVKDVERDRDGLVQVVCGAPNVREDLFVAWLPPGATVPESYDKEPFVLEAREIRGHKSNGMLASPKELAISDSHTGILELDGELKPGADFAEIYGLKQEMLVDIENKMFTHRPDCFGLLGVAREIAGIQQLAFHSPDWYTISPALPQPTSEQLPLTIKNELPELVPRFTAVVMNDIKVQSSPVWLQVSLSRLGVRPINNIVDMTNYYMLLTGQPLHAYDYDKVKALSKDEATIVVRNPKPGEKVRLLSGKEIEPRAEAIMIATDQHLIGVGGVMGGSETEVDENTKNIVLECANFDMYSVRRTSMAHGLFTDASTRFTKGQSPLQNPAVLVKIARDIEEQLDGRVAGVVIDDNHVSQAVLERGSLHPPVKLSAAFINARLGLELSAANMKKLLENVEFTVAVSGDELTVTAPFWRTDIELREDVVEEVGRLYGYDHLPLELPPRDLTPAVKDPLLALKAVIRDRLSRAGANEVLTYSFVHGDLLQKVGQDPAKAFQLSNALSPDLQYYRLSLLPSLLEKVHPNSKAGYDQFALFEIGKTHNLDYRDDNGLPKDVEKTAFVWAASRQAPSQAPYYHAKRYLEQLARDFGLSLKFAPLAKEAAYQMARPFDPQRSADVINNATGQTIGIVGEFTASTRRALKLPAQSAGFEISTESLLGDQAHVSYQPLPRFPKVTQDISLKVPADLPYQELFDFIQAELDKTKPANSRAELSPVDIYQGDDPAHKHITLRFTLASYERTMTDKEVNQLLDSVAVAAKTKFGAERL